MQKSCHCCFGFQEEDLFLGLKAKLWRKHFGGLLRLKLETLWNTEHLKHHNKNLPFKHLLSIHLAFLRSSMFSLANNIFQCICVQYISQPKGKIIAACRITLFWHCSVSANLLLIIAFFGGRLIIMIHQICRPLKYCIQKCFTYTNTEFCKCIKTGGRSLRLGRYCMTLSTL